MASRTKSEKERGVLNVSDPNLPFLAANAAVEIDDVLHGRETSLESAHALATLLHESVEYAPPDSAPRSLMGQTTLTVLGEAIIQSKPPEAMMRVDDLLRNAEAIAESLNGNQPPGGRFSMEWARGFCVSLSRAVASYHMSIFDLRPSHPCRR